MNFSFGIIEMVIIFAVLLLLVGVLVAMITMGGKNNRK